MIAKIRHSFTLVELLVAMVVLVVMMGFLFHFTIGAQRIWSATTSEDEAFQNAQILMQVFSEDLENSMFSTPDINPDDHIPFYIKKNDGNCIELCFLTIGRECETPSLVIYDYDATEKELHRTVIENEISYGGNDISPMGLLGTYDSTFVDNMLADAKIASSGNTREIVCEKLTAFDVKVAATVTSNFVTTLPGAFQLNFTIEQEARNDSAQERYRCFSKTIFFLRDN